MKPLNLPEALELYEIIGKHIPEETDDEILDFVGKIVSNIRISGEHRDYVKAVSILTGQSIDELLQVPPENILELFIEGLSDNKIIYLKEFSESIGLGYARS